MLTPPTSSVVMAAALVIALPQIGSGQNLEQCPVVPQLQSGGVLLGARFNHVYTYSIEDGGSLTYDSSAYYNNVTKAFTDWANANNTYEYGSRTGYAPAAAGTGNVRVILVDPAPGGLGFSCPSVQNPLRRCDGLTIHNTGGLQNGAIIGIVKGLSPTRILEVMIHEIFHFQGADDATDSRTAAAQNSGIVEITACDALAAGRFAASKRRDMLPDACRGAPCRAPNHPALPVCYWGALPNGGCYPDPRYKYPPGNGRFNVTPVGLITSPSTVGTSGALTMAARDQNGTVRLVDWYVNGSLFYTATEDPFDFPYANVQAGTYQVKAVMLDDLGEYGQTATVSVTVEAGGGSPPGGSGGTLSPWQRLYANQRLYSANGAYYLIHQQSDGHLVEYINNGPAVWATGFTIPGGGGYTEMDGTSGNLVSYYPSGWPPYWAANPPVSSNSYLRVQDDGTIKIYSSGHGLLCTVTNIPWGWNGSCP